MWTYSSSVYCPSVCGHRGGRHYQETPWRASYLRSRKYWLRFKRFEYSERIMDNSGNRNASMVLDILYRGNTHATTPVQGLVTRSISFVT